MSTELPGPETADLLDVELACFLAEQIVDDCQVPHHLLSHSPPCSHDVVAVFSACATGEWEACEAFTAAWEAEVASGRNDGAICPACRRVYTDCQMVRRL